MSLKDYLDLPIYVRDILLENQKEIHDSKLNALPKFK